jgi:hypothetical protein
MHARQLALVCCTAMVFGASSALAGPCGNNKDAGAGPTPGFTTGQATQGSADKQAHPPTQTMNQASEGTAASAQDAQRQQQGQPTAAEQAKGAKPTGQVADKDC